MTWHGLVADIRFDPQFGRYAYALLRSPTYPVSVTTDCLFLNHYPIHIQTRMIPGWNFIWTIDGALDRLEDDPKPTPAL